MQLLQISIKTSEIQLTMLCIKVENLTRPCNTTMQHAIKSSEGTSDAVFFFFFFGGGGGGVRGKRQGSLQQVSALKSKFKSIKPVIGDQKHESQQGD